LPFRDSRSITSRLADKVTSLFLKLRAKIDANLAGGKLHERTGKLRSSLEQPNITTDGAIVTGELRMGEGVPYTLPLELGSARHVIRADKEALRFYLSQESGKAMFRKSVIHPAIKSVEFWTEPINESLDEMRKAFFEAFAEENKIL